MAGAAVGQFINFATPYIIRGIRNYTIKYGPGVAKEANDKGEQAIKDGYHARDFVRENAITRYNPLSDEEYEKIVGSSEQPSGESICKFLDCAYDDRQMNTTPHSPRKIYIGCQTIRASRELFVTEAFSGPLPLLSHWLVEIDGIFYELRTHNEDQRERIRDDGRVTLHRELGQKKRQIKFEVTTNRTLHAGTERFEVGTTTLNDESIMQIASLVFREFSQSYDLYLDNCQLFSQLLCETIAGRENVEAVRSLLEKKSGMKIPLAASWIIGPAYHVMATAAHCFPVLHELCPGGCHDQCIVGGIHRKVNKTVEEWEKLYYHPRIFAAREQTKKNIDSWLERLSPFD